MKEILQQHITDRLGNDIENLDTVLNHFKILKIKRNQFLLKQGEICNQVYFIAKGCLQVFI